MKVLVILVVLVACAYGNTVSKINQKLIPSFESNFVIKGSDAKPNAAPYIVSLRSPIKDTHICGGTIIDKMWLVTAAHCMRNVTNMRVIAGLYNQFNVDNKTQSRTVDWAKTHENYEGNVGPFDIGLLHLSEPLEFNPYVQPALLPAIKEIHSGKANLYGWGQTKALNFGSAEVLQTVETELIPYEECKETLPENSPIHVNNICSSALNKSISACNGDSGGPLVIQREGVPSELIGVVSWGYIPCGYLNKPSIFTRMSAYIDWITKIKFAYYALH